MSYDAERWARQQKTGNARAKFVLLMLANYLNDETGKCCPSIARLCEDTEMTESTVLKATKHLVSIGLISKKLVTTRTGRCCYYTLNFENGVAPKNEDTPKFEDTHKFDRTDTPKFEDTHTPKFEGGTKNKNKEIEQISKEKEKKESARSESRATSFSLSSIPNEWIEVAEKIDSEIDAVKYFEDFADYWRSVPATKGRKRDWLATWRNAIRSIPDWKRKNFLKVNASNLHNTGDNFMDPDYWANEVDEMM